MAGIMDFMESPLVSWVRTFSYSDNLDYQILCEGVYLLDVLQQIDQRDVNDEVKRQARDSNAQIHNWKLLLSRLHSYYNDVLQHVVVMKLPDVVSVVKDPCKDASISSVRDVLLLLLGCSVLCDQKAVYIERIKQLDLHVQTAIVDHIKQITDSSSNVLALADTSVEDDGSRSGGDKDLYATIQSVATDRDHYAQSLMTVIQERDYFRAEAESKKGGALSAPSGMEMYQLSKEVKQYKTTVNSLTQELEEKNRQIAELRDDNERVKDRLLALKTENLSLMKDAKTVRYCRDELDALKEKAIKVEKYENDILKYKELGVELEFSKSQVEELRNDNNSLSESKYTLESELRVATKKADDMMDDIVRCQLQLEQANHEKESLEQKLIDITEENTMLEIERSNMNTGFSSIKKMLSNTSLENVHNLSDNTKSLSDEMASSLSLRVARLETENKDLTTRLEQADDRLKSCLAKRDAEKEQHEVMYKRRVAELESQVREIRQRMARELSQDFAAKVKEVEDKGKQLKQRLTEEFHNMSKDLTSENNDLRMKLKQLHDDNLDLSFRLQDTMNERDQHVHESATQRQSLQQKICDLEQDKRHLQAMVNSVQRQSSSRLHTLQRQVSELGTQASSLQRSNEKISDLCNDNDRTPRNSVDLSDATYGGPNVGPRGSRSEQPMRRTRISYVDDNDSVYSNGDGGSSRMSASFDDNVFNDEVATLTRKTRSQGTRASPGSIKSACTTPTQSRATSPGAGAGGSVSSSTSAGTRFRRPSGWGSNNQIPAATTVPVDSPQPFSRNHPHRATITSCRSSTSSSHGSNSSRNPFSRNDVTRQSMPERGSSYRPSSRNHNPAAVGGVVSKSRTSSTSSASSYRDLGDSDSGHASPDSPKGLSTIEHILSTIQVTTTETVKRQAIKMPKGSDKYKTLIAKVMELQDRNQQLLLENSEIRRVMYDIRFSIERIDAVEKKNMDLEVENRRLRKICESLQAQANHGRHGVTDSPYHYYSSV